MKRTRLTKKQVSGVQNVRHSPYDLNQLGMGYNQPCPRCGKAIDRKASSYEPVGFVDYCKCQ